MSRAFSALLVAVFALGGLLFGAGVASAHSFIVSTDPADGAQITQGPPAVTVTFDEAIQKQYAALTVVGPDGHLWSHGEPTVQGATVSVPVGDLGPTGKYTIAVRVTSADGHVVSYTRSFTLTQPGHGTPGPLADQAQNSGKTSGGTGSSSGGVPIWPFVVAAVVLFGGGLAFALRGGKSR